MDSGDSVHFFLIGFGIVIGIIIISFILRKRKKVAITLSLALLAGYVGYYAYFPTMQENTHAERYRLLEAYLSKTYPEKQLAISPKHYEAGDRVGEFNVNDITTPTIGVVLRVDEEGQVSQIATWSNINYPAQQEVWQDLAFSYGGAYSLDKEMADITKEDMWIDGELSVFALTINGVPSIAVYHYSNEGYGLVELTEGNSGEFVTAEADGRLFIYIDKNYQKETITVYSESGQQRILPTPELKGQLLVGKLDSFM